MDFSQNSDSNNIKSLLDKLKGSQAWHQATAIHNQSSSGPSSPPKLGQAPKPIQPNTSTPANVSSRISSLLSMLGPITAPPTLPLNQMNTTLPAELPASPMEQDLPPITTPEPLMPLDLRNLNFQQSLGHVSKLLDEPETLSKIRKLKDSQDATEAKLWKERQGLIQAYEQKVKVAQNTSLIVKGTSLLPPEEVKRLQADHEAALNRFDTKRVLPTWDALVKGQQQLLEELGTPGIFETSEPKDRDKQQRIIRLIEDSMNDFMT